MVPWSLALEWTKQPEAEGIFYGLGKYSLDNAWRLDYIFNLAKEKGIYLMLSLGNYGDLMAEKGYWNEQRWQFNPYNLINDGPCQELEEFWTKEIAKKYYKNKLRYILARWGYSTNLLSLEFFNEVDAPIEWVKEMGGFVKTNDPGQHLLTISPSHSFSPNYSEAKIWGLPEIDYTQIHLYGHQGKNIDLINELTNKCLLNTSKFKKPCLVAEFGIDSSRDDRIYDPQGLGVNIHQGLWTAAMSGSFGGAMNWWWDTYVEAKNLYYHYKVLANFAQTIDWNKSGWQKAEFSLEQKTIPDNSGEGTFSNLIITPEDSWGNTDYKEFTISNNGEMNGGKVNSFLHGYEKESIRLKPIFHVNYPQDGKFILRLGTVSKKAVLNICLDDKCVSSKELPTGPEGTGHWKKSEYKRQWDRYFCLYDEDCEINIPKGRHMISLENTGSDWVSIEQITLTNYVSSSYPNIRCLGLTREKEAIVWFQNKDNNWYNNYKRIEIKPLKDISLNLLNMSDGYYNIEWWDTYKGEIIYRERVISKNGCLAINIPELTTDIAAKINKL